MDGYVAEVVAYVETFPKLFNVQMMEVVDRYDHHMRVKCADCYFHYLTLCAMGNM